MMRSVAEVFQSSTFNYVYTFYLGSPIDFEEVNQVYELSEDILSEEDLKKKKSIVTESYNKPIFKIKMEEIN